MKYKLIFFASFILALLSACTKDENKVYFEKGTAPVLTASTNATASTINLNFSDKDHEAIRFSWTNPDYEFNTGVSSQNVTYQVEIDTTGANFTNPKKKVINVTSDLGLSLAEGTLNDYLLNQLELKPAMAHNIEVRVKSSLANNKEVLTSNVLKFTTTPYAIPPKVEPPASGTLYITGGATPKGWMGGGDAEVVAQKFTKVSDTRYELESIELKADESFLFVPVYGDWGDKYGFTGDKNANDVNGDTFKRSGNDIKAPGGTYKIVVDFQTGKYTLTKI